MSAGAFISQQLATLRVRQGTLADTASLPADAAHRKPRNGSILRGIVVRQKQSRTSRTFSEASIYDGETVFTVQIPREKLLGRFITGRVELKKR